MIRLKIRRAHGRGEAVLSRCGTVGGSWEWNGISSLDCFTFRPYVSGCSVLLDVGDCGGACS